MDANQSAIKRLEERRKKAALEREKKKLTLHEVSSDSNDLLKGVKQIPPELMVSSIKEVEHTKVPDKKEIVNEAATKLKPVVRKLKITAEPTTSSISDHTNNEKYYRLDESSMEDLVNMIINGLMDNFVRKDELPYLVHKILQESLIDKR